MSIVTTGPGSARTAPDVPDEPPPADLPPAPPAPERTAEDLPAVVPAAQPQEPGQPDGDPAVPAEPVRVVVRPRRRRRLTWLRWLALLLLTAVLVGAGAMAGSQAAARMPTMYAAHADVLYPLVQEQPTGFLRQDRNLSTQEVLLASRTVLDTVAVAFAVPVEDLEEELTTEVVEESEIIRVQFRDESRAQARKVLDAIVTRYLEVANNPARTELRTYLDTQIADVQARLATARTAAEGEDLGLSQAAQAEIDALVQREATLLIQRDEEQLAAIGGPAPRVTVAPYVGHDAVSPRPLLVIGGGALAGLVVALIVVAVLARRMTRP